jgi:hypothetical protein
MGFVDCGQMFRDLFHKRDKNLREWLATVDTRREATD